MATRWWGRLAGLAIVPVVALPLALVAATGSAQPALVVRGPDQRVLVELRLPDDGGFALRYRNSLYRSTAEERYRAGADGTITLVDLAADELAVLEEYYAIDEPAAPMSDGARAWRASPARDVVLEELTVAATDLGRRTLLVEGQPPIELWRLVDDSHPSVTLEVVIP